MDSRPARSHHPPPPGFAWRNFAGWPRVIAHPRLPQIRTCPIRASGSSI
jgi:hypothetical protein